MYNEIVSFIDRQWHIYGGNRFINSDKFNEILRKSYNDFIKNKTKTKTPFMFRLAGQSGSGKTTQLLPSLEGVLPQNFIKISVRSFAVYHPQYDKFDKNIVREKTNGFALYLLFRVLELLLKNNYNILFEVTLLDYEFEEYLLNFLKNYVIHFHILSIPLYKTDKWIKQRQKENGRIVLKKSSNYFYNILPVTLNKILKLDLKAEFYLWNGFDGKPICNDKNKIIEQFNYYRKFDFIERNENILLEEKRKWFKEKYKFVF